MTMSFSTTKGVAATVIHRLADRGLIDYDEAVATYWPEFGAAGKHHVTVRQMLSHQAGLHAIAPLIHSPEELLDHHHMEALLAAATPRPRPGTGPGYHGFTFGWLVSGLARAVTGKDMRDLVQEELAGPLKTDGLHIGVGEADRDRVAPLLFSNWGPVALLGTQGHRLKWTSRLRDAFFIEDFDELLQDPEQRIIAAQMPAVSGVFTARALATMYGALGQWWDGGRHGTARPRHGSRTWARGHPGPRLHPGDSDAVAPGLSPGVRGPEGAAPRVRSLRLRWVGWLGRSRHGAVGRVRDQSPGLRDHPGRGSPPVPVEGRCLRGCHSAGLIAVGLIVRWSDRRCSCPGPVGTVRGRCG
jgi:CubicO group peptidase (beta-lactamase class C family)